MNPPTRCATHPEMETNLRCGKCGKPICPRCMVQTPVGARCRECARGRRIPTYDVTLGYYLRAAGAALGMALATGIAWGLVGRFLYFFLFNFLLAAGVGYAVGEVISLAVNRKRGRGLQVIAGAAVFLSFLVKNVSLFGVLGVLFTFSFFNLLALALGIFVAVMRLR